MYVKVFKNIQKHTKVVVLFFSDIITIENTRLHKSDILAELSKQYEKLTHCRKKNFMKEFKMITINEKKTYNATLTLLPHQTLIMPESFKAALTIDEKNKSNINFIKDSDLR